MFRSPQEQLHMRTRRHIHMHMRKRIHKGPRVQIAVMNKVVLPSVFYTTAIMARELYPSDANWHEAYECHGISLFSLCLSIYLYIYTQY